MMVDRYLAQSWLTCFLNNEGALFEELTFNVGLDVPNSAWE
jgi:hypothetical protein